MTLGKHTARRAFSLLEMVLALALGMLLLLALYLTLNMHIAHSQAGRGTLGESGVARFVATRIGNDITGELGPLDLRMPDYTNSSGSSGSSATPATTATTTTSPAPIIGSGTTSTQTTPAAFPPYLDPTTTVNFNLGVHGDSTNLVLSVYRVQKPPAGQDPTQPDPVILSDVRRVNYWLITNGSDTVGLARAEIPQATSLDADTWPPSNLAEQNKYIIADEIKNILFEYFDGTTWQPTWDGTALSQDGITPVGPPAAIRITMTMRKNLDKTSPQYTDDGTVYVHVVALPGSNNFATK